MSSKFLKRASKISEIAANYDTNYAETDFDYDLDLTPFTKKYPKLTGKIVFDLTAGLWNKSVFKEKKEFVAQWEHNLIKIPETNQGIYVFWHYGLNSNIRDGSYNGKEIGEYLQSRTTMPTVKFQPLIIEKSQIIPRLVLLPFFRDMPTKLEKELNQISSDKANDRRNSLLYSAISELIRKLVARAS